MNGSRRLPGRRSNASSRWTCSACCRRFQAVLTRARNRQAGVCLPAEAVSIEARMEEMLSRLAKGGSCGFDELFADLSSRQEIIVTFSRHAGV